MIPSDHFTRFYNEVFKFLEQQGESHVEEYFLEISKNQERHILDLIREKGFAGMFQYWNVIRDEENCELDLGYDEDRFELRMHLCPSLSKPRTTTPSPGLAIATIVPAGSAQSWTRRAITSSMT